MKSLLALAIALAAFGAQATSLISNGSFESGTTSPTDWTISKQNGTLNWASLAYDGYRSIELDNVKVNGENYLNSGVTQTFTGGGLVELSFWYIANAVPFNGATNTVHFTLGTITGSVMNNLTNDSTTWQHYTQQINLGKAGPQTLSFAAAGTQDNYGGYIDNVSVTAVPEPESYAMLLAGLALMGTIALRRNKDKAT